MVTTSAALRVFVLGATGGTGRALVDQALARGHRVTAFVRSPDKLGALRDCVTVRQGDPRSADELVAALPRHDAVVSALGPPGTGRTTILGDSARALVSAMQSVGVQRLLVVSAGMLFADAGVLGAILQRTFLRNVAKDSLEMEHVIVASGVAWTIVRPPRLTSGALTGSYNVADARLPPGRGSISRADVARFMLDELAERAHVHRIVGMAGAKRSA